MLTNVDWYRFLDRNREPTTAATYSSVLNGFCERVGRYPITLADLRPSQVEEHMTAYKSPRSANTFLTAVKSFAKWARRNEEVTDVSQLLLLDNMSRGIESLEYRKVPRPMRSESLTQDALAMLLLATERDDIMHSATLVHFYFGARPVELATPFKVKGIHLNDAGIENAVDFDRGLMSIVTAKFNHTRFRIVPFPEELEPAIRKWVKHVRVKMPKYARPHEWYTKSLRPYCSHLGLHVTAKSGRKTVETEMS
ncbi:MAG: hypothetical protein PHZ19_12075, partial [Candidatus Thermoplasmatota archaeon]|nr:hypothetical protein [Candidatus Thermoplasmatota archaeon]